jgi:YD repeat-containing protein
LNAATTAYVYDPFSGELTHILDNSNLYTRFEYDAAGRLVRTYKEKLNTGSFANGEFKTNQYLYNYSATKYTNDALNVSLQKNNCPVGWGPSTYQSISIPGGTYTSFISKADANATANIFAQDYANTHDVCHCIPTFTFASYITGHIYQLTPSSTISSRISFAFVFDVPSSGGSSITIGQITNCVMPTATRTIPMVVGSSVYNVVISTNGTVQAILASGPAATGTLGLSGVYDLNTDLFYSAQESGSFTRNNCPSGQVGTSVTYTVRPYAYAATDQTSANNLALADVSANGQSYANSNGTCNVSCSFNWNSSVNGYSANVTEPNSSTVNYDFVFSPGSSNYTGSTIGTIVGVCTPGSTTLYSVQDNITPSQTWNVTITPAGVVTILLTSGGTAVTGPPIEIKGSFGK